MKYYIVNVRHKEVYRPATVNQETAFNYCSAMNLVTSGVPYAVRNEKDVRYLLSVGWQMCDWVGLFRKLTAHEESQMSAKEEFAAMLANAEERVKQGELPF